MARFPKLIVPAAPGGLQSMGLQQRPIDLGPLIESVRAAKAFKSPAGKPAKTGKGDTPKITGLIGEAKEAERRNNEATKGISSLIKTYGDLAFDLPEYQQHLNTKASIFEGEQNTRNRNKEDYDRFASEIAKTRDGVAVNKLFNLSKLKYGILQSNQATLDDLQHRPDSIRTEDDYSYNALHGKDATDAIDNLMTPAMDSWIKKGGANIFRQSLEAGDIPGIMRTKWDRGSNEEAMHQAFKQSLQQADVHVDEKTGKVSWTPTNMSSQLQGGLVQELLQYTNAENDPRYRDKQGKFKFKEWADDTAPLALDWITKHYKKRLRSFDERDKTYSEASAEQANRYMQQNMLITEAQLPATEITHTVGAEVDGFSHDNIYGFLGMVKDPNAPKGEGSFWNNFLTNPTTTEVVDRLVSQGIFQRSADKSGKPVYVETADWYDNLNKAIEYSQNGQEQAQLRTLRDSLTAAKNSGMLKRDAAANMAQNIPVYLRANQAELATEVLKDVNGAGKNPATFFQNDLFSFGGNWFKGDLFKGFDNSVAISGVSNTSATLPRAAATNFVKNVPIFESIEDARSGKAAAYSEGYARLVKDAVSGKEFYVTAPIAYDADESGRMKRLNTKDDEYSYAMESAKRTIDNPASMNSSSHATALGVDVNGELNPANKAVLKKFTIDVPIQVPADVIAMNKSQYEKYAPEVEKAISKFKPAFPSRTLGKATPDYKSVETDLGFDETEREAWKKSGYDQTMATRLYAAKKEREAGRTNRPQQTRPLMTSKPIIDDYGNIAPEANGLLEVYKDPKENKLMFKMTAGKNVVSKIISNAQQMKDKNGRQKYVSGYVPQADASPDVSTLLPQQQQKQISPLSKPPVGFGTYQYGVKQ